MKLLILFVFIATTLGMSEVGESENDVTRLKLQYLEERIHSLEQPGNILLSQPIYTQSNRSVIPTCDNCELANT